MDRIIRLLVVFMACISFMACEREGIERTWEMEMEELDARLKKLESEGARIDTTHLSVFYRTLKQGEGPYPQVGDTIYFTYRGYLPTGKIIEDSNDIHPPKGIWKCVYKPQHKVTGMIDALIYMNKGAELEMYITSDLAYGKKGTTLVPPYTTLIYRVTMHDVVQP